LNRIYLLKLLFVFVAISTSFDVIFAQNCTSTVQILPTNPTGCGLTNGSIQVTEYNPTPLRYQWSLNGTTWFESETTQSNLAAGFYLVRIRDKVTQVLCRSTTIELHPIDAAPFTGFTVTNSSSCITATGQITLNGIVGTDSVSWISKIQRNNYVRISTLTNGNRITGLRPGTYYVRVKRSGVGNTFCYTDKTVVIAVTGVVCDIGALCPNTSANLFPNGNFGAGTPLNGPGLSASETQYGLTPITCSAPDDGLYAISNTTDCNGAGGKVFNAWDITLDHTPADVGGYMMVVNASFNPDVVIEKTIVGLCPNTEYEFSAWIRNICIVCGIQPNLTFLVDGVGRYSSGNIGTSVWTEVGFRFTTGATQTSATVSIRNNAPGGGGNDWALDDIFVGLCIPDLSILPPPLRLVCLAAPSETIGVIITDPRQQFDTWQWQESLDGGTTWSFLGTPTVSTFNSSNQYQANYTIAGPLGVSYNGRKYRIRVASTTGNLTSLTCSYVSPAATITLQIITPPVATASIIGPACTNGVLSLNSTSTISGSTFAWTGPNSFINATQNPTITAPTVAASGTYTVTVRDPTGTCTNTASVVATVNPPPTAIAGNNGPVCPGSSLNLTASGGSTYAWTGPSNFTRNIQNPTISFVTANYAGIYNVIVTSAAGCTATASTTVVVSSSPIKPGTISY
jgi:hypothetical protein